MPGVEKSDILATVGDCPAVIMVKAKICKLNPPLGGQMSHVSVEMEG